MANHPPNRDGDGFAYESRLDGPPKRKRRKQPYSQIVGNTRFVGVRVPLDLFERLQEGARNAGCTMSDLVVAALTVALLPTDTEEGGKEDA